MCGQKGQREFFTFLDLEKRSQIRQDCNQINQKTGSRPRRGIRHSVQ